MSSAVTGRDDYDQIVRIGGIQRDEPTFILKAGDIVAADTVRAWTALAHAKGCPAEVLELALQQADRMEAWPDRKAPDGPDLGETDRLQLRYQFERRAWRARAQTPTPDLAMAEQLGVSSVVGKLRPLVADLIRELAAEDRAGLPEAASDLCRLVGWNPQARWSVARGQMP